MKKRLMIQWLLYVTIIFSAYSFARHQNSSINNVAMSLKRSDILSAINKEARRKELYGLLGKLPDRKRPIHVKVLSTEETDEMITEKLLLDINGFELVPAYFTKPKNAKGKLPVILFNHSHFGEYEVGKEEFVRGRKEMQK